MRLGLVVAAVVVSLTVAGCGGEEDFQVQGKLTINGSGITALGATNNAGEICTGTEGYDDITEGAQVVIRDADGKKVALGRLGLGHLAENGTEYTNGPCVFKFKVSGVPGGSSIYSVEVSHRGEINFKQKEARGLALTLGD